MASAAPGARLAAAPTRPSTRAAAFFRRVVAGAVGAGALCSVSVMASIAGAVRAGAARAAVKNALRAKGGCKAAAEARNTPRLTKRVIIGELMLFASLNVICTALDNVRGRGLSQPS